MNETNTSNFYLTPSHLLEFLYCPRFTYFEFVLAIPERQEKRFKVQKGRDVHDQRMRINPGYLRKKLGVQERELDVELSSTTHHVRGRVDEVLTLDDDSMAPFDYKYSIEKQLFHNQRIQIGLYAILIEENYGKPVKRGYLCYTRSNYKIREVPVDSNLKHESIHALQDCLAVIQDGFFPPATQWERRCPDCCYRNLCIK